jgi:nicotinic acid mononucleotide adenylyltransferase
MMAIFYKGSFNPVHTGHIMNALLARSFMKEPVVIVPNGFHPTKQYEPLAHRMAMLHHTFQNVSDVYIANAYTAYQKPEQAIDRPIFDMLNAAWQQVTQEPPLSKITQLLGMDAILRNIKRNDPTLGDARFSYVLTSRGNKEEDEAVKHYMATGAINATVLPFSETLNHSSSTALRQAFAGQGNTQTLSHTPKSVRDYIYKHRLYQAPETHQQVYDIHVPLHHQRENVKPAEPVQHHPPRVS